MDDVRKVLQLILDNTISPEEALIIFERWKKEGKKIQLDPLAFELIKNSKLKDIACPVIETSKTYREGDSIYELLSKEIITVVAQILKMEVHEVTLTTPIQNYGIDSVAAAGITMHFSNKYQIPLTPPMVFEVRNIDEFIKILIDQFHDKITNYYRKEEALVTPYHDSKISIPGAASEDDQNVSYVTDETLFVEGKHDLDSMWALYEQDEMKGNVIECRIHSENVIKGESIILTVNNEIVEIKTYGNGKPLLLIGDLGCDELIWQSLLPYLSKQNKIYIYYPPGHGKSTLAKSVTQILDISKLLKEALVYRNIPTPIPVIGYSAGGAIALELALNHPDLVKSLVLISTSAKGYTEKDAYQKAIKEFEKLEHLFKQATDLLLFCTPAVMEYYKNLFKNFNVESKLPNIGCSTLIICGKDDQYISPEDSKVLQQGIKNAKIFSIPHAGHYAILTNAEDIFKNIKGYI